MYILLEYLKRGQEMLKNSDFKKEYLNILKQNEKIDVVGCFEGFNKVKKEEVILSGILLLISLLLIAISFSISRDSIFYSVFAFLFLCIGFLSFSRVLINEEKLIRSILNERVNEKDTEKLISLKNNGSETREVVSKILSEHEDGFLTYEAIAKYMDELIIAYHRDRSKELTVIFNKIID